MIGVPFELPKSYSFDSGAVISNFDKLSDSELFTYGIVPIITEDVDLQFYSVSDECMYDPHKCQFTHNVYLKPLPEAVNECSDIIDVEASNVCAKYMTSGIGQEMRYMEKFNQAVAFLADPSDPYKFPMIMEEAELCEMTYTEKANEIISTRSQWIQLAAKIESIRVGYKKVLKSLGSVSDIISKKDEALQLLREI